MPHLHFLATAISPRILVAGLPLEARMVGMTYVEGHSERLRHPPERRVEFIADMLGILFGEALDDAGASGHVSEIAEWRELHPMILAGLLRRELIGQKQCNRSLGAFIRQEQGLAATERESAPE